MSEHAPLMLAGIADGWWLTFVPPAIVRQSFVLARRSELTPLGPHRPQSLTRTRRSTVHSNHALLRPDHCRRTGLTAMQCAAALLPDPFK